MRASASARAQNGKKVQVTYQHGANRVILGVVVLGIEALRYCFRCSVDHLHRRVAYTVCRDGHHSPGHTLQRKWIGWYQSESKLQDGKATPPCTCTIWHLHTTASIPGATLGGSGMDLQKREEVEVWRVADIAARSEQWKACCLVPRGRCAVVLLCMLLAISLAASAVTGEESRKHCCHNRHRPKREVRRQEELSPTLTLACISRFWEV